MADRGILFSGPMVRALIAGTKYQTRRLAPPPKFEPQGAHPAFTGEPPRWWDYWSSDRAETHRFKVPNLPGDRLYVRETCSAVELRDGTDVVCYDADKTWRAIDNSPEAAERWMDLHHYGKKRGAKVPGIHMPRWASRLTLKVSSVRVERLHDITRADCVAEGHPRSQCQSLSDEAHLDAARDWYEDLWISLHGLESWKSNPWVIVYGFSVLHGNIDKVAARGIAA